MIKPRLQAHRGVSSSYPENTITAFRAAVEEGYDIIELDTKYTLDGVCVIFHDRTLMRRCRTTDGEKLAEDKNIADITFEEARSYDVGLHKSEKFKGEKMPTLKETIEFIKTSPIPFKFDNVWETFTDEQKDDFIGQIKAADLGSKVGVTCRHLEGFERVAKELPESEMHWDGDLDDETLEKVAEIAKGHRLTIWIGYTNDLTKWHHGTHATPEFCDHVRKFGEIGIWILKEEAEYDYCVTELKANAIETTGHVKPWMYDKFNK